jgi:class 3 adenylate cyclase/tetratricopeptide (TPR) repeat protein
MAACPSCGEDNPEQAKFCWNCATPLTAPAPQPRHTRKTVTVLFCDVTGSTALGERLDPETVRAVMGRYFTIAKRILERHGGTVEKFIGDAVMAVFGVPALHEDDALRAVRAAAELREALTALDAQLTAEHGIVLNVRVGIHTGEAVAGDAAAGQTLITGDAVNTAARLETAAQPAEILIGDSTYRLVRDAVEARPVEPLTLKGKAELVPAYRLLSVTAGAAGHTRHLDAPMVGRDRELSRLRQAFEQVVTDRAPQLFTLLGSAGVGKSRLAAEFVAGLEGEARVLRGHCLPYGEGITYWPIGEIVRQAADVSEQDSADEALAKVRNVLDGQREADGIASAVSSAIGLSPGPASREDVFWAIRRWLEWLASRQPLVVVLEDIHWAEPTLLDLVEYIGDWAREVPLLVLCTARPDLLDARPGWSGAKLNAANLLLEPLGADVVEGLIEHLSTGPGLPVGMRAKIIEAAEGNPLFIEEMVAMLREDPRLRDAQGDWLPEAVTAVSVPPSITALLAARLDQLAASERAVAGRGSVVGRVFDQDAVVELSPAAERATVNANLLSLVRKELLRPDHSDLTDHDAFRFRHILIRDAAYQALPKFERAELHERFADWLERVAGERLAEYEEILGYHLDQAYRLRSELGAQRQSLEPLAHRAAQHLAGAGRRASERGDVTAATSLLERAVALFPPDAPEALAVVPSLVDALFGAGRLGEARDRIAALLARPNLDPRVRVEAMIERGIIDIFAGASPQDMRPVYASALAMSEDTGDAAGEARALMGLARIESLVGRTDAALPLTRRASDAARRAANLTLEAAARSMVLVALYYGRGSATDLLGAVAEEVEFYRRSGLPTRESLFSRLRAVALAMRGEAGEARQANRTAREAMADRGQTQVIAGTSTDRAFVEEHAGDLTAAERELREGYGTLEMIGATALLSTVAAQLALLLARQGRRDEAETFVTAAEKAGAAEDVATQVPIASARAWTKAQEGAPAEAVTLAREAVAMSDATDYLHERLTARLDLAAVLESAGDLAEAIETARAAEALAEEKGDVVCAERSRDLIARLRRTHSTPGSSP